MAHNRGLASPSPRSSPVLRPPQNDAPFSAVVNMANSVAGVGVLTMPFVMQECGIVLGLCMMLTSCLFSILSSRYVVYTAHACQQTSYEMLASVLLGPTGRLVAEGSLIGQLFGVTVAFFLVVGDVIPRVLNAAQLAPLNDTTRTMVLWVLGATFVFPVSLSRNIEQIAKLSLIAIGCYVVFTAYVMVFGTFALVHMDLASLPLVRWSGVLPALPILSLAFAGQTSLFMIFRSLPEPDPGVMSRVISQGLSICFVFYTVVGLFGFAMFFGSGVSGNVLKDIPSTLLHLGFGGSVLVSFPLVVYPCRSSLFSLLATAKVLPVSPKTEAEDMPNNVFLALTAGIVTTALVVAIVLPEIQTAMTIVGSTAGAMICYYLPGILALKAGKAAKINTTFARALIVVGVVCTASGLIAILSPAAPLPKAQVHIDTALEDLTAGERLQVPNEKNLGPTAPKSAEEIQDPDSLVAEAPEKDLGDDAPPRRRPPSRSARRKRPKPVQHPGIGQQVEDSQEDLTHDQQGELERHAAKLIPQQPEDADDVEAGIHEPNEEESVGQQPSAHVASDEQVANEPQNVDTDSGAEGQAAQQGNAASDDRILMKFHASAFDASEELEHEKEADTGPNQDATLDDEADELGDTQGAGDVPNGADRGLGENNNDDVKADDQKKKKKNQRDILQFHGT